LERLKPPVVSEVIVSKIWPWVYGHGWSPLPLAGVVNLNLLYPPLEGVLKVLICYPG
jgi:hypothetical protein